MKHLTRDWYEAGHDDDSYFTYRRHLTSISESLNAPVLALALSDLHDARFLDVAHDPESRTLSLRLRIGFRRIGYADLHLRYLGVDLLADAGDPFALLNDRPSEVIYHEIDVLEGGRFEHRLLLAPSGQVTLRFDKLEIGQRGVEHRAVP